MGSPFLASSWEHFPAVVWAAPSFVFSHNMSLTMVRPSCRQQSLRSSFAPYNEEEPASWFCLIEVQFAVVGIKSQKLRYTDALASLPKQVLRDILDTVDVCNKSDQPNDLLKEVLLGQF